MSDLEKPVVESVPPDRKADIRKKVDRLSNMLQGSTSVSGILKARYQEALDKLKKQNTANQEVKKKIDELEKERERLKGQLEEQKKKGPVAGIGAPGQAGKSDGSKDEGTGAGGVGGGSGAGPGGAGSGPGTGAGLGVGSEGAKAEGLASENATALGQGGSGSGTGKGTGEGSELEGGSKDGAGLGMGGGSGSPGGLGIPQKEKERESKPDKALDKSALGYPPQKEEEKSPELDPFKLEAQNRERELADLLKNTEAKIQAQKAEMERQSLAALNVQMLEAIKDNFKSLSKMIAETAMTPERFRSMASSYGIGLDDQLVSSMMTSLPQASTERAALQEIKGYLDGIKGGSFGSPGEGTGVNVGGASGARGKFDKAPSAISKLSLDKDGEETEEGGDHVYTVIEKIENSKIDIHSKIYNGGLGVGPMVPMQGMPMGSPMAPPTEGRVPPDGKGKEGPAPGTVGPYYPPDLLEPADSEISPADDRRAGEDRRGKRPDRRKKPRREDEEEAPEEEAKAEPEKPEEPEKKPEEDKEKSDAEKQAEKEKEEAAKKAAEEPPPPAFNPYNVSKEDDVFEEPKPVAPPAPPKPKEKKKPEEKDKAGGKDGKDDKKPEAKKEEGKEKLEISLINDDYEKYGKYLKLTYLFDNMPNNLSYSKYKKALRNACRITLLGNLEEGLNLFNELKKQKLPLEYIEMIDKNIRDVKYYLRGKFRSSEADLE